MNFITGSSFNLGQEIQFKLVRGEISFDELYDTSEYFTHRGISPIKYGCA